MIIKGLKDEDFLNYRKPSMFIISPSCTFKCDRECGYDVCQNSCLAHAPLISIDTSELIERYRVNDISKAVVWGGLEPFDTFEDLYDFIFQFRNCYGITDDIVIYTGYNSYEIENQLAQLKQFSNIIIKFGRYIPQQTPVYDEVLGVTLASPNQYGERIS